MRTFIICSINCILLGSLTLRECSRVHGRNRNEYKILVRPPEGVCGGPQINNTGR